MATLHQFELFVAVARRLSISQTAEQLHISPSSISKQLNEFQREFGAVFLKPTSRGIELTARGKTALMLAEAIVNGCESFKTTFGSPPEPIVERLTLGASHGPAASVFPGLMRRFSERFPTVQLNLQCATGPSIEEQVLKGNVDLAVIANPPPNAALEMEPFRKEALVVFVAAKHPLAKKKFISPAEFSNLSLIIRGGRNTRNRTEELLDQFHVKGYTANVLMRMESPDSVKTAVRREGFAGILYRDVVEAGVDTGQFKILNIPGLDLSGVSYIVHAKAKPLSPAGLAFLAELRRFRSEIQRPAKSLRLAAPMIAQDSLAR